MKNTIKLTMFAAALAAFGTTTASADDQHLQNRLACQRDHMDRDRESTTVGVYAGRHHENQRGMNRDMRQNDARADLRDNGHGQAVIKGAR